jgi:5-methylcytosine-specific restriction endonuclease McrA
MICNKCEIDKPLTDKFFRPSLTSRFGFRKDCRDCEARKARERWDADPEHGRAILRAYLDRLSPIRKEEKRKNNREWQDNHYSINRQHKNKAQKKREMKKKGVFVEHVDRDTVYQMHGGMCGICEEFIIGKFHVDHVIPISKGGLHCYTNVQPAHPSCNLKKSAKIL